MIEERMMEQKKRIHGEEKDTEENDTEEDDTVDGEEDKNEN